MPGSQLFQQNRALGYVSNHVRACIRYIEGRQENIVTTCVGQSFHVYGCNSFRLIRVGGLHPEDISALAADGFLTYTAADNVIYGWRSSTQLRKVYRGHEKRIHLLLPFGKHLISVDEDSWLKVWIVSTAETYAEIPFSNDEFCITAIMHPAAYKNKILLGSQKGGLQLWNLKSAKLVHRFAGFDSRVAILEQAPAIDVVAVGLQSGRIVLLNLKFEKVIMELHQDWGPVTAISFRTDGQSVMASGSTNGQVVFWNLEEQVIASTLNAHDDAVTSLQFLPNEPLMVTSSPDNSLRMWVFDLTDGAARLLRYREGHAAPPTCIRYHGAGGRSILSAGEDSSLRIFSTVNETVNRSMGKASYNRKATKKQKKRAEDPFRMPPISFFTSEVTRDKEWDSIAAIHQGIVQVTTWSYDKCRMGELRLVPEVFQEKNRTVAGAIAYVLSLSQCGNYVTVGYSSGHVERFNIQSGQHRASYGSPMAHQKAVRGLASDTLNQFMVTGGADSMVKFWPFKPQRGTVIPMPNATIELENSIGLFRMHRDSAMVAVGLDNFAVLLLDTDTRTIVRRFIGHKGSITDMCFSPDSRWLITAAQDCTVKVWDIPSSYLIDHFRMPQICSSMTMSPTGNFLATSHVDCRGIYLWANKSLFQHVSLRALNENAEAPLMTLPSTICEEGAIATAAQPNGDQMDVDELEDAFEQININYKSPPQLSRELITMSDLAASRWQNLLNLDIIKKRNKPRQALEKPKSAPFFLPTVAGLEVEFDTANRRPNMADEQSRIIVAKQVEELTSFGKLLKEALQTEDFQKPAEALMQLGPSKVDYEVRNLTPFEGGTGSLSVMGAFMRMLVSMFDSNHAFELAQSYLSVFLKVHGRTIVENEKLRLLLPAVEQAQSKGWTTLEDQLLYGMGVVSNLRNFNA